MRRETSLYLHLVRFCAALTVFASHVSLSRLTGGFLWQLQGLGVEAVMVFFVLSGFVIAYVTDVRENNAKIYTINRLSRMYSVAIPALILTFLMDGHGKALRPDLYAGWGQDGYDVAWQYVSGLFFVNELWFSHVPQGSDLPYWSLGYEVWYYIIFGLGFFTPRQWKIPSVITAVLIAGPKIMIMFPLWLLGFGCYHLTARVDRKRLLGSILFIVSIVGWIVYEVSAARGGRLTHLAVEVFGRSQLIQDYLIGTLFAANLVGFAMAASEGLLNWPAPVIRWLAGATFSIYLFHYPVMHFLAAELSWPAPAWRTRILIIGGTLVCCFALAELTERQKDLWRAEISKLSNTVESIRMRLT